MIQEMRAGFFTGVLALFFAATTAVSQEKSGSEQGELDCNSDAVSGSGCLLTLASGVEVGAVRARDSASGERREAQFTAFENAAEGDFLRKAQAVILIDDSTNVGPDQRRRTMAQIRGAANDLVRTLPENTDIALVFYDQVARTINSFGASASEIESSLDELAFSGDTTRTFGALSEVVASLAKRPALTRSVYLFTDGEAEDAASRGSVVAAARKAKVSISVFIAHWRRAGAPERGGAETMFQLVAKETGGAFAISNVTDAPKFNPRFSADIADQMKRGGLIRVDGASTDSIVSVDLVRPGIGARREVTEVSDSLKAPRDSTPAATQVAEKQEEKTGFMALVRAQWLYFAIGAGVLLLLLLAALMLRKKKAGAEMESLEAVDPPLSDDDQTRQVDISANGDAAGPVLARLRLNRNGSVMEIRDRKFSIGRGSQNEVVLDDDSISRIHCEFHMTRDEAFAITDLRSLNGTTVNGEPVSTKTLTDGDVIRLGEVDVTFHMGA